VHAATIPRRTPGNTLFAAAHALHLYGAAAIALGGWAFSRLLGFAWEPYAPLWFAGALLIYNIDRLKHDPSDAVNTPMRRATVMRLRRFSVGIILSAALTLVLLPILRRDWLLLSLTASGGVFCANYSLSPLGFRLKDLPLLKTFLAPTIVVISFVVPPLLQGGVQATPLYLVAALGWLWQFLSFNMILCDLRDIPGDSISGTRSLPVVLGPERTFQALHILLWTTIGLGLAVGALAPPASTRTWLTLAIAAAAYEGCLLWRIRTRTPGESFYEWWVEGMLFVPPLIISLSI
jgi:4-hydroxybenzoate polyprenyltransferase